MDAQAKGGGQKIASERVEFPSRRGNLLVGDLHRSGEGAGRWLVLCHGMESTRGGTKQAAMVRRFVPKGYTVLRFDFSYVGDSEGEYEDLTVSGEVDDALGALDFVHQFGGATDCTLVGSSLGGLVALLAATKAQHVVSRVATIAPVADSHLFTDSLSAEAIAGWRSRGRRRVGAGFLRPTFLDDVLAIDAPSMFAHLKVPVLVLHGDADNVVPPSHADIIAANAGGPVTVKRFPGVGHRFEEPGALSQLLDALEEWLGVQTGR